MSDIQRCLDLRRELLFLKGNEYSPSFREKIGHKDEFFLLEDDLREIDNVPGVYVIVASDRTNFIYPNGKSSVIYIGKSDHLRNRLRSHKKNLVTLMETEEDDIRERLQWASRYHYMKVFGAKVYTFDCKGKQDAKELESYILHRFYEKYRALPVGNGARSFGKE